MVNNRPYIIAEMSGNHNRSLERAMAIVDAVADAGCDALKLQTYTADSITLNCDNPEFIVSDSSSLWFGQKLYDLYRQASTPYEWHKPLFERCKERGIVCFSTPFDLDAVCFLESLDCPMYKIASCENGDIPLLKRIAQTHKPTFMSLGMIVPEEIDEAVHALIDNGCPDLTLLKCTSAYPADPANCNLLTISDLKKRYPKCRIGLSDHTLGIGVAIAAIAIGAEVIEKHFTLSRSDGGIDSAFSMEPHEMKLLISESRIAYSALGHITYELSNTEKKSLIFRRSLYISKDVKKGELLTQDNIRSVRPALGIPPKFYDTIIGSKALVDMPFGTPVQWKNLAK